MNILTNSFSDLAVHRTINRSLRYFQIGSSHASIIYHILYHINYFGNDLYVTFLPAGAAKRQPVGIVFIQ